MIDDYLLVCHIKLIYVHGHYPTWLFGKFQDGEEWQKNHITIMLKSIIAFSSEGWHYPGKNGKS